jgi:hypothetical protein
LDGWTEITASSAGKFLNPVRGLLSSIIGGVIWSAATGSLKNLIVPVVLGMVLGVGPSIVTGGISAII